MNDHFILPDLIYDQIVADRKSPESAFACRLAYVWRSGDPRRHFFNARDETGCRFRIVCSNVRKNFFEIGKGAAFISKLHALR